MERPDVTYTNESGTANGDPGSFTHVFPTTGFYTITDGAFDLSTIAPPSGLADLGSYTTNLTLNNTTVGASGYTPASAASFTTDVWSVVLDSGESNDLLIASSDGTQNLQELAVNVPRPGGEAVNVTITSTDPSQNDVWTTGTPVAGTDTPVIGPSASSYTFVLMPGVTTADFWTGALAGSTTAGVLSFSTAATVNTANSTSTFLTELADGGGSVPATGTGITPPTSKPVSDAGLTIELNEVDPNDSGSFGPSSITDRTLDWLVGQYVDLVATYVGPSFLQPSWDWTVPGDVLEDYVPTQASAKITHLYTATHLLNSGPSDEIKFFWVSVPGSPTAERVSLTYGNVFGGGLHAYTTFNVNEPTWTAPVTPGKLQITGNDVGDMAGLLGIAPSPADHGIVWSPTVTEPAGFAPGGFSIVQKVMPETLYVKYGGPFTYNSATYVSPHNGEWVLDGSDPYHANGIPFNAPPGMASSSVWATGTAASTWDRPELKTYLVAKGSFAPSFQTYLMYLPPGGTSRFIPLARLDWNFKLRLGGTPLAILTAVSSQTIPTVFLATAEEPGWDAFIQVGYKDQPIG